MGHFKFNPILPALIVLATALGWQWAVPASGAGASPAATTPAGLPLAPHLRLTAKDGAGNDQYGAAVAASEDTIVIGAYSDDIDGRLDQGSVYVFSGAGGDWTIQQKLMAPDGEAGDQFGTAVAISGNLLVVGAPRDKTGTNTAQGSAYIFLRSSGGWAFQQKLTAQDGEGSDQFGASVAISGGTVVAGAFTDDVGPNADQGSAYVFIRSSGNWLFQQKLLAVDGAAKDQFGAAVAISGETIVAGALLDDLGTKDDAGSAYVFERTGTTWASREKLTSEFPVARDLFGAAIALSGNELIIGAPFADPYEKNDSGIAYAFKRTNGVWALQRPLIAQITEPNDQFGCAVALRGDRVLIGAHFDDDGASADQGSAYLFTRSEGVWAPQQKILPRDLTPRSYFGRAVALTADRAVISAPQVQIGAAASQGAVYLYGCGFLEDQKLTNPILEPGEQFGHSVAIDGDTAVVGVFADSVGSARAQGSAYVFTRTATGWVRTKQLFAFDGAAHDWFGYSVAISGGTIVVGAPGKSIGGNQAQGAAYFFVRSGEDWILQARAFGNAAQDHFGWSVSIDGNLAAVSSPNDSIGEKQEQGSVTIFARTGTIWAVEKVLSVSDGESFDFFGWSTALSGDRVLIGMPGPNDGERSEGAAYLYQRDAATRSWIRRARLTAGDAQPQDQFGMSVALDGTTALVLAPGKVYNPLLRRQAAYVFIANGTAGETWSQQDRLLLGEGGPRWDNAVALRGNMAVAATSLETIGGRYAQGTVRVFTRIGATWSLQQEIVATDGQASHFFGESVALSGNTIIIGATQGGANKQGTVYALKTNCGPRLGSLACVSAASFSQEGGLAPESITSAFGANLARETRVAASLPLPTTLAGVSLKVTDSTGAERLAPLFFVSADQINYLMPEGTSPGPATLRAIYENAEVAGGEVRIAATAPGIFSANADGQGVAAAVTLRVRADASQRFESVARLDPASNRFVAAPIDLGPATDQVFLVLYGTGLRYRSSLSAIRCTIGGAGSDPLFAGPVPGFPGFDQINLRLPRSLAGRGEVEVLVSVDGKPANPVRVSIR
ncbi:MAG: hypothetical protein SF339_26455 [Blastocatellia bacterium]|nr:hypothetical protein [Blastocatellia bacterium]